MFAATMMMAGKPLVNLSITISENTENYNLITDGFGGIAPTKITVVDIVIEAGVIVYSDSTVTPPLDLTGLPDGSTINLANLGLVIAAGGSGGTGRDSFAETDQ